MWFRLSTEEKIKHTEMLAQQAGCVAEINSIEQSGGMTNMIVFILGIVCGIVGVGVLMPQMGRFFFEADRSRLSFEETIDEIRKCRSLCTSLVLPRAFVSPFCKFYGLKLFRI